MREQTIVWRNDFENIEFAFPIEDGFVDSDWAHSISKLAILSYMNSGKSIGNFFKCSETGVVHFETFDGWKVFVHQIEEFAFLEQSVCHNKY